jgi:hypothetical protein
MAGETEGTAGNAGVDLVVFMVRKAAQCGECGEELWPGSLLRKEGEKGLCVACADLDHLEYLPSGDAALTRRAGRYSRLKAVVVCWSRTRKRYERQGILVEAAALQLAEQETLAAEEVRARRQARDAERRRAEDRRYVEDFARAVRQHYPRCPAGEARDIAEHACRRSSGRVGRTAAARALDPAAIRLAVAAHVRHAHTNYDELLACDQDRECAREEVRDQVTAVLRRWEEGR